MATGRFFRQGELWPSCVNEGVAGPSEGTPAALPPSSAAAEIRQRIGQPGLPGLAAPRTARPRVRPAGQAPIGRFLHLNGALDGAVAGPRPWFRLPVWGGRSERSPARYATHALVGGRVECP